MAASRSFGAFSGAQSPPAGNPMAQVPSPGSQSSFAEVLSKIVPPMTPLIMAPSQPMTAMPTPGLPRIAQDSTRLKSHDNSALAMLAAKYVAKPAQQSPPPKSEPSPTGFIPGVRPEPTGWTGHEMAKRPEKLDAVIADLKTQGLKPTAANLVEGWNSKFPDLPPANPQRIRTAFAKHTRAQQAAAVEKLIMRGALGATKAG